MIVSPGNESIIFVLPHILSHQKESLMNRRPAKAVELGRLVANRPGIIESVSAVFVFLAAFFAVATYLGSGAVGLVSAGVVAVVVAVVYLLFYGWIARLPAVRRLLEAKHVPASVSTPLLLGGGRERPADPKETRRAPRKGPRPQPESPKPDLTAMLVRGIRNVCDPGPHDVESGRPTKLALEVERGFTLVGTLEEQDGDDFEWMIVDEDNWVRYLQSGRCDVEGQGRGKGAYKISWRVPSGGPWFLVLEAYGKQFVREVSMNLRLSSGR